MVTDDMAASEYLNQLLQDKTTITKMPKIFLHAERLLDEGEWNLKGTLNFDFVHSPILVSFSIFNAGSLVVAMVFRPFRVFCWHCFDHSLTLGHHRLLCSFRQQKQKFQFGHISAAPNRCWWQWRSRYFSRFYYMIQNCRLPRGNFALVPVSPKRPLQYFRKPATYFYRKVWNVQKLDTRIQ